VVKSCLNLLTHGPLHTYNTLYLSYRENYGDLKLLFLKDLFSSSKNIFKKLKKTKLKLYFTQLLTIWKKTFLIHPVYTLHCQVNVTRVALDENKILQNLRKIN
jgi:hypothetical protein